MKNWSKTEVEYRHRSLIDFWSIFGPFLEPKSLQNGFQSGFGKTLSEDVVLNLQKDGSGEGGVELGPPPPKIDMSRVLVGEPSGGGLASHAWEPSRRRVGGFPYPWVNNELGGRIHLIGRWPTLQFHRNTCIHVFAGGLFSSFLLYSDFSCNFVSLQGCIFLM